MGLWRDNPGPSSSWSTLMGFLWDDPTPSSIICWRVLPMCLSDSVCVVGGSSDSCLGDGAVDCMMGSSSSFGAVTYDDDDALLGSGSIGTD